MAEMISDGQFHQLTASTHEFHPRAFKDVAGTLTPATRLTPDCHGVRRFSTQSARGDRAADRGTGGARGLCEGAPQVAQICWGNGFKMLKEHVKGPWKGNMSFREWIWFVGLSFLFLWWRGHVMVSYLFLIHVKDEEHEQLWHPVTEVKQNPLVISKF